MAGSYKHLVDDDGNFTMYHIENLGDAEEALEECFFMIGEFVRHLYMAVDVEFRGYTKQDWIEHVLNEFYDSRKEKR